MTSLQGKVALVTGGASGLGEQICLTLASEGVIVIAADIKKVASGIILDVSDEVSIRKAFEQIKKKFGRLDILVNNAGIDVTKPLSEVSSSEWEKVLKVNLFGPFLMSKYAFGLMDGRGGHVVNIASTAAKRTWENASAYHASKWGLLGFSHAIHTEGRKKNIKVTAVIAGGMRTPFIMERFPDTDPVLLQDPKNVAEVVKFVLTQPEETVIPEIMVIPLRETSWP